MNAYNVAGNTSADGTSVWDGNTQKTVTVSSADVTLYSATKVVATGSNMDVKNANTTVTVGTNGVYVPVGENLSVSNGSSTFTGFVVTTSATEKHSATSTTSFTVAGKDTYNVYGAYKLTLNDGVKAIYGSTVDLASGVYYVDADTSVTPVAVDSTNQGVLKDSAIYADTNASAGKLTADTSYSAATKVTMTEDKIASFTYTTTGGRKDTVTVSYSSANKDYYFLSGEEITVVGATMTAGTTITVTDSEGEVTLTASDAATSSLGAAGTFTVGTKALTVNEKSA